MNRLPDPSNLPTRASLWALLLLVLLAAGSWAVGASGWSVEIDGQEHAIRSRTLDDVVYLSATDLASAFGGWIREDRHRGNFQLEVAGTRMVLSAREGLASIDGRIVSLPYPNRVIGGELWVAPDLVDKAISPVFPRTVERTGTGFRVRGAVPIDVVLRSKEDPQGTRCVLEFSRAVRYRVASGPGGVSIQVLEGPLRTERVSSRVPGSEVEAVRFEPAAGGVGGTFSFQSGPTFRGVRDSRLDDPFRIVLDFDREAPAAGIPPPPSTVLSQQVPEGARTVRRVVIDPGHGGSEVGAQGPTGLFEKDVVLDIARRVAQRLRREAGLEAVLTRDTDKILPLDDRAGLANHEEGDLFVSIHANASRGSRASGAETYFLSYEGTDDLAVQLAEAENKAGGVVPAAATSDGIERVLWDMAQREYQRESFLLAETIQREMNELLGTRDRGVRQAPFRVLMGVQMPAVLVEVAFISNPEEEESLKTSSFRDRIAQALAGSIARYKQAYEMRTGYTGSDGGAGRGGS